MNYLPAAFVVVALTLIVLGVITLATGWLPPLARRAPIPRLRGLLGVGGGITILIQTWQLYLDSKSLPVSRRLANVALISDLLLVAMMIGVALVERRRRGGSWARAGVEMTGLVVSTLAGMYVLLMIVLAVVFSG